MNNPIKMILAAVAVSCALLASHAQAASVLSGTSTLPSTNTAGNALTVDYNVDLTGGVYTYSYTIHNPANDTTSVHGFQVSFDNNPNIVTSTSGGSGSFSTNNGVNWFFAGNGIAPGGSATVSFTTLNGPTLGQGQA